MFDILYIKLLLIETLIYSACIIGDYFVSTTSEHVLKALMDSSCHGIIAALSWCMVVIGNSTDLVAVLQVAVCGFLAMVVDLDHFWMAGSLSLKAATSLPRRPPLHNSTLIPAITIAIYLITKQQWIQSACKNYQLVWCLSHNLAWILLTAWTSHHVRDATRRGLWFAPIGSTSPLPYKLYIIVILMIPIIVRIFIRYFIKDSFVSVDKDDTVNIV